MAFFALLFLGPATAPARGGLGLTIFALVCMAGALYLAVRGLRLGQVDVGSDVVKVSTYIRTRTFPLSEIADAEGRHMTLPFLSNEHRVLVLRLRDGRAIAIRSTNARIRTNKPSTWVDEAAAAIRGKLAAYDPPD
jgi:hypothetical protein